VSTRVQPAPRSLMVRIETVACALVCIQTVLRMTSLPRVVKVVSGDVMLRAATHVSARPMTSSSAGATCASSCVSCLGSTSASSFMLVGRGS
jgi:hypothetical protein